MTASQINELRLLNKKLNQRLVRIEKTAGTSLDLTKTPQYKRLQELAAQQGVKPRTKTAGFRFKEKNIEKMDVKEFEKILRISKKAEAISSTQKGIKKAMKETQRRLEKGGISASPEQINDILISMGGAVFKRLLDYFDSGDAAEIMEVNSWNESKVSNRLDLYEAAHGGEKINLDELREYLFTGNPELIKGAEEVKPSRKIYEKPDFRILKD